MQRFYQFSFLILFSFFIQSIHSQTLNYRQGELIVWLKPNISIQSLMKDLISTRNTNNQTLSTSNIQADWNIYLLKFDFAQLSEVDMMNELKMNPKVQMVQKNHLLVERKIPNDTYFNRQWQHLNDGTLGGTSGADFRTSLAWDITTGGLTEDGDSIVVCVIDGGLEHLHADLKSNIWYNTAEIPNNKKDDDLNGYIDDYKGWNSYNSNDSIVVNNHGTEVCGIIGAIGNNRVGVSGVNWQIKIMMVQGGGDEANAIISYSYPWKMRKLYNQSQGKKGAYVVATNSSWGRDFGRPSEAPIWCAMYDSLGSVGILNAASTTNLDLNVDEQGDLPTNCESEYLLGVTNLNWDDKKVMRAGYGIKSIDIGAYGEEIFTTTSGNTFANFSGTSAASPQVCGAIALLYSAPCNSLVKLSKSDPAAAALLARDILLDNARKLSSLKGLTKTEAVLDLNESMYGIVPLQVTANLNEISFQSTQSSISSYIFQYRKLGEINWNEIEIINNQKIIIDKLDKCTVLEYRVKNLCQRFKNRYSNIQTITTKGCCLPPQKVEIIESGIDNIIIGFPEISNHAHFLYLIRESGSEKVDSFEVSDNTSEQYLINGLKRCTKFELQLINFCDGKLSSPSAIYFVRTNGCDQCDDVDYCTRDRPSADFEWLESIEIDHQRFVSGNNNGFGNFVGSGQTWALTLGDVHSIKLIPGYQSDTSMVYLSVWIDWNHNAILEEFENIIPKGYLTNISGMFNFNVPVSARTGLTRMRAIVKYGENGLPIPASCYTGIEFGEYEDYCVNIVASECFPIEAITEISKTSTQVNFSLVKHNPQDVIYYKYRKLPFGIWSEKREYSSEISIAKLDSCSYYELSLHNDCDLEAASEKIVKFNTVLPSCLVATVNPSNRFIEIYPNPFKNTITFSSTDWKVLKVYNLQGKLLFTSLNNLHLNELNFDLNTGFYIFEIMDKSNHRIIRKMTKI